MQKAEQLSITWMILEQWKAGKIKRSPENILALLADFEKECSAAGILGLTEHDREGRIKKELIRSVRNKAEKTLRELSSGNGARKTAAAL